MSEPSSSAVKSILDLAKAFSYAIGVISVALLSKAILSGPHDFDKAHSELLVLTSFPPFFGDKPVHKPASDEEPSRPRCPLTLGAQAGGIPLRVRVLLPSVIRLYYSGWREAKFLREYSDTIDKITTLGGWKRFWGEFYEPFPFWLLPIAPEAIYISGSEQALAILDVEDLSDDSKVAELDVTSIDIRKLDPSKGEAGPQWTEDEVHFTCAPSSQKDIDLVNAWQGKTAKPLGVDNTKFELGV